jgi:outer membrane protein OmpA-like peptidoglycan-associated protein
LAVLLATTSCSSIPNPIDWYHGLEGGRIAEQRPPPPNADAPYPNLSTVPAKLPEPDNTARTAIANGLVADRANAQYSASLNPLVPPSPTQRPAPPPPRPDGAETAGATLQSAAAPPHVGPLGPPQPPLPPVTPSAARKAPTAQVESTSLEPPAAPAAAVRGSVDEPVKAGTPAAPVASLPDVPAAPPPPPVLAGVPQTTAPAPPPPTPPAPPPPPAPAPSGAPVLVGFPPGSSVLPVEALGALKILSRQHGDHSITVTGYGDATGTDAKSQADALPLALSRARAVAANLLASGVPSSQLRINAEAQGHGAAAAIAN